MSFTEKEYREYLISEQWHDKKRQRLQIDNFRCQGCGKLHTEQEPLDCHHVNYYRFSDENIFTDLESLCPECHKTVHRVLNRITGYNPDGSYRRGWRHTLPPYLVEDLKARGLM